MEQRELKRIISKAVSGDRMAFEELYRIFLKSILFAVSNQLDDSAGIEDVTQDIICEMYKRIGSLKKPEAFRSWMHTIIRRTCFDANIKARRPDISTGTPIDDFEDILEADDEWSEPAEVVEKSLTADRVMKIIESLPRARKQVVIMYYYDGMNDREIAEALGITRSTVKTNLMRARDAIRKAMEQGRGKEEKKIIPSGVALTPAIMDALHAAADAKFSTGFMSSFSGKMNAALDGIPVDARHPGTHHFNPSSQAVAGVSAAVAACVIAVATLMPLPAPAVPEAVIVFSGGAQYESLNPSSAHINLPGSWRPVEWTLKKDGKTIRKGYGADTGAVITSAATSAGSYSMEWLLENDSGHTVVAVRDFTVKD